MNKIKTFKISGAIFNVSGRAVKYLTIAALGAAGINLLAAGIMDITKIKKSIKG